MRAIIPCAGFGTRAGMKPGESKELLEHPDGGGSLILRVVESVRAAGLHPLIIVRQEKKDLIRVAELNDIEYLDIESSIEWAHSVMKSESLWEDHNLLVLPDLVTTPGLVDICTYTQALMYAGADLVFSTHEVADVSKWGYVNPNLRRYWEKPTVGGAGKAWATIGFTKNTGPRVFAHMLNHTQGEFTPNTYCFPIVSAEDVTRGETKQTGL